MSLWLILTVFFLIEVDVSKDSDTSLTDSKNCLIKNNFGFLKRPEKTNETLNGNNFAWNLSKMEQIELVGNRCRKIGFLSSS